MGNRFNKQGVTVAEFLSVTLIAVLLVAVAVSVTFDAVAGYEFEQNRAINEGQQRNISNIALSDYYAGDLKEGVARIYYLTDDGFLLRSEPASGNYTTFTAVVTDGGVTVSKDAIL